MHSLFTSSGALQAAALLSAAVRTTLAVDPVVELDYTSYRGTEMDDGVTRWMGMRFAAAPVDDLRFRAPIDPMQEDGPIDADAAKPYCLTTEGGPPSAEMQEDCLFLNVFAPSNATSDSKLPVFFFIQGGGFNTQSAPSNGSGLIIAGDMDLIVVNIHYRVGPYGFLAGDEILADGSTNNGLKDQRKAMEWVQNYISCFGGDPDHVTIGGASAGAQSVDLHVLAYNGRDDGLFQATAAESQSFPPLRSVNESQFAYDNLVIRTGCQNSEDTLDCLRNLTATELQDQNINTPFPGAVDPPLYMYGPTLDFDFISDYSIRQYREGKFIHVPAIAGDDTDEGTVFTPSPTANISEGNTFLKNQFPGLTPAMLRIWNQLFPLDEAPESLEDQGEYFRQSAWAYGETRYICPTIYVSGIYANESVPNWNYRYNVQDPEDIAAGLGVTHVAEGGAVFGPKYSGAKASLEDGGVNAAIVPVIQGYWTSFIRTYNPNTFRAEGSPRWRQWTSENYYQRLKFETNSTMMETVSDAQQVRQTDGSEGSQPIRRSSYAVGAEAETFWDPLMFERHADFCRSRSDVLTFPVVQSN